MAERLELAGTGTDLPCRTTHLLIEVFLLVSPVSVSIGSREISLETREYL